MRISAGKREYVFFGERYAFFVPQPDTQEWSLLSEECENIIEDHIDIKNATSITFEIEEVLKKLRSLGVSLPNPREIRYYLIEHPDIAGLLPLASQAAKTVLGTRASFSLELYHSRETKDEYPTLYIRQESYDEDIMDSIDRISETYEKELIGKTGWFLATTDFKRPA